MKTKILICAAVLTLAACGTTEKTTDKQEKQQRVSQAISDSITNQTYTINVNYVLPRRFPSRALTTTYTLRVQGDSVISYLPYLGVAYRSDYGSTESPLSFSAKINNYQTSRKGKDGWLVSFVTRNKDERILYQLNLFDNGRASVTVVPDNRESIDFTGEMIR